MRRGFVGLAAAAALVAVVASGCTSSGSSKKSVAPTSTQAPPPSTTSAAPSTSASPTPTAPLSAYEADPAVQALRKWEAEGARTVNTGHYTSPTLRSLETAFTAKYDKTVWGGDVGSYYPGPAPYQPLGVTVNNSTTRTVHGCAQLNGFAQNRTTHKPARPLQIAGFDAQAVKVSGRWLINGFYADTKVSCAGVKVKTQQW